MLQEKSSLGTLLRYGLPSLAALAVNSLYSAVDAYFVGTVSVDALAAVGIVVPVLLTSESIFLILSTGISTVVAQRLGANQHEDAQRAFSAGFTAAVVIGVAQTGALFALRYRLSVLFTGDPVVAALAARYLQFVLPATLFGGLAHMLASGAAAQGKPGFGMVVMGIGGVVNIVLDFLFITVLGYGVEGAAIATTISSFLTVVTLVIWFLVRGHAVSLRFVRFGRQIVGELVRVGLPTILFQALMVATIFSLNTIAGRFGVEYVAIVTLVNRIVSIGFLLQYGFARGVQPIISYHWGSRNEASVGEVVRKTVWVGVVLGVLVLVVIGVLLLTSIEPLFGEVDLRFARRMLAWWAFTIPFGAVTVSAAVAYMAIGKSLPAALLIFLRQGLVLIPVTIASARLFGLSGFALGPAVADMAAALVSVVVFGRSVFARPRGGAQQTPSGEALSL